MQHKPFSRKANLEQWKPLIQEWRTSGLSVKDYCVRHSINPSQFRYWQYQVKDKPRSANEDVQESPVFTDITPRLPTPAVDCSFELITPQGHRLIIPSPFDPSSLATLLKIIGGVAC